MKSSLGRFFNKLSKSKEAGVGKTDIYADGNSFKENDPEKEINLKIMFLGCSAVGAKTSFVDRYIKNAFDDRPVPTIGPCFHKKGVVVRGKKVELQIWDTPGQERYMPLMPMYYRGTDGFVLGYDITNKGTLGVIKTYYADLRKKCPDAVVMVIGNKVDLENDKDWGRKVSYEEGDELANELGAPLFFETSAKTGFNVNESMSAFVEEILSSKGMLGGDDD